MKVRFQADADLNQTIVWATLRREPTVDFQTASSARLSGLNDSAVLARAAEEGRVLVTHDRRTMPKYFAEFIVNQSSTGLLIIPQQLAIASAAADLILIWSATSADEWINRIAFLPL
jgi:hypothetical protein